MPDEETTEGDSATEDSGTADLGDAGKKALEAERAARREAERKLKAHEDAQKSELQKMQDAIAERDAQLAELPRKARAEAIRFSSLASSAGFVDPEDALLNLGDIDLADGDAVRQALTDLAERKPHLVREQVKTPPRRPKPANGSQPATGDQSSDKERAAAALRALRTQ